MTNKERLVSIISHTSISQRVNPELLADYLNNNGVISKPCYKSKDEEAEAVREDYMETVANRMAERLINGENYDLELWRLASSGWREKEIEKIAEKALEIAKANPETNIICEVCKTCAFLEKCKGIKADMSRPCIFYVERRLKEGELI